MAEYFDLRKTTLDDNHLSDKLHQIYNVDETGMPFDHHPLKVIVSVDRRRYKVEHPVTNHK